MIAENEATLGGSGAAKRGGGIFNADSATPDVSRTTFRDNLAESSGGALMNAGGTVTITDSLFIRNTAPRGGAILNLGSMTLTNCAMIENTATSTDPTDGGGAIGNAAGPAVVLTITNCTIAENLAVHGRGGGILNGAKATITHSTIDGNHAGASGGGLHNTSSSTVSLVNTIVARNTRGASVVAADLAGSSIDSGSNNLIGIGGSGGLTNGSSGNIVVSDLAALGLGSLGDHSGRDRTIPLLPGSPALRAGKVVAGVTTDQRGKPAATPKPDIAAFQSGGFEIAVVAGQAQSARPGSAFTSPLTVSVTAKNAGEPVAGGTIAFTSPTSGASATFVGNPATIAANGQASVSATANGNPGAYTVAASAKGIELPAEFSLTNLTPPTASISTFPNEGLTNLVSPRFTTVTGTAAKGTLALSSIAVSLANSSGKYWNGTTFTGSSETFSIAASGTDSWTASLPAASKLADGVYTARARATDTSGFSGAGSTKTFSVDKTSPTAGIQSGPPLPFSNSRTAAFSFSGADAIVNGVSSGIA